MHKLLLGSALILFTAGCEVSPLQKCQAPIGRALTDNQSEIDAVQLSIDRGYTLAPARVSVGVNVCASPITNVSICAGNNGGASSTRVPVDIAAQRARLNALQASRANLQARLSGCARDYPAI